MGILSRLTGKPNKDDFANLVINAIREAGDTEEIQYDQEKYCLRLDDGSNELRLDTIYAEYCNAPRKDRPQRLENLVQMWFEARSEMPEDFEDAVESLLPRVRERVFWHIADLEIQAMGHQQEPTPYLPLNDFLGVGLVYDLPWSMRNVSAGDLETWGIDLATALERATDNLRAISLDDYVEVTPGLYVSPWQDNYDSSRALFPERFHQLGLNGKPVYCVPTRDHLLVCGSEDIDALGMMAAKAYELLEDPRVMCAVPMILEDGQPVPYRPPEEHPYCNEITMLRVQEEMRGYQDQKILLDRIHEDNQIDVFVASFKAMQNPEGAVKSISVITKGVDTLVPKTDLISMVIPDDEVVVVVTWDDFEQVAGRLLEDTDHMPVRYRVRAFPSDEEFETLKARDLMA